MSNGAAGTAAGVAVMQAICEAVKASGAIVNVEPPAFNALLGKISDPLIVCAEGGLLKKNYQYLTSYRGFCFYTKSATPLHLPGSAEVVTAKKIWVPNF